MLGQRFEYSLNVIELLALIVVMLMAFAMQIFLHELPCPLCLLQRVGFIGISFGLLLNLHYGSRPIHYGLSLLSALFLIVVAARQVFLHIIPGSGSYGSALFGLHLYTWSFIAGVGIFLLIIVNLVFEPRSASWQSVHRPWTRVLSHVLMLLLVLLALSNALSAYWECGWKACPDNVYRYHYLPASLQTQTLKPVAPVKEAQP